MELSKEELGELAQRAPDDPEAFRQLYDYFFPKIYQYIYHRVNNHQTAEDLVSDIFMKILKNARSLRDIQEVQGWFFSIAKNALIDHYRKKGRQKEDLTDQDTIVYMHSDSATSSNTPEADFISQEYKNEFFQTLEILSPEQQEIVQLRFLHDLKIKEIAQVVDKSEGAVKGLLYRGLKKLSQALKDKGVTVR